MKTFTKSACLFSMLALLVLGISCKKDTKNEDTPASGIKFPFYSENYSMSQTQSSQLLSDFFTSKHLDYHQFGWNIGGSAVVGNDTVVFFLGIEYAQNGGYRGGAGFSNSEAGFKWQGYFNNDIQITSNPWSAKLTNPADPTKFIKMEMTSGLMGSPNSVLHITANTLDLEGKTLKMDVVLKDPFGAINQGYGTTSLFPNYLKDPQRAVINTLPEKSIEDYLTITKDSMVCQGSYYYAIPLMDVDDFTIIYDTLTLHGAGGKCWMDYFVKSFNAESIEMQAGSKWNWIAIQLPETNTAINVLHIQNDKGDPIPFARMFNKNSERSKNGAAIAAHSWNLDEITVEGVEGSEWPANPGPGEQVYFTQYKIELASATLPGSLTVNMLRKNQTLTMPEGSNYQGIGIVDGTIGGQIVHGQCWVEVQPKGLHSR